MCFYVYLNLILCSALIMYLLLRCINKMMVIFPLIDSPRRLVSQSTYVIQSLKGFCFSKRAMGVRYYKWTIFSHHAV